jgi:hypothetical protein
MDIKKYLKWFGRFTILLLLFYILFISGTLSIAGLLPDIKSEPGAISNNIAFLILGISNTLLIIGLIQSSRWNGLKLILLLSFAYFGAVTFLTQIETWYFLSNITVNNKLLTHLFIMGLPIAFIYIPLAVFILGKYRTKENSKPIIAYKMPWKQMAWKLFIIVVMYLVLYWCAGYYIAWQNQELRAFYGSPGDITPFWKHTFNTFSNSPNLFPFQVLRALLWTLCTLPVIYGSKINIWWTSILVGLFLTIPQNAGLLLENPLMPIASVRMSHMIEGFVSNFTFALIIVWLLHREHKSIQDLIGLKKQKS